MLDCRERESGRAPEESGAEGGQIAERRPSGPARQISIVSARWRRKADRAAPLRRCAPLTPTSSSRAIDAPHAPGRLVPEMPYRRSSSGTDGARQPGARQYGEFERLCWAGSRTCARQNNAAEWLAWWPGGGVVVVLVVLVVPSSRRPHLSHPPNARRPRLRASLALARSCASAPRHTPLVCSAHTHTGLTAPSPLTYLSRSLAHCTCAFATSASPPARVYLPCCVRDGVRDPAPTAQGQARLVGVSQLPLRQGCVQRRASVCTLRRALL